MKQFIKNIFTITLFTMFLYSCNDDSSSVIAIPPADGVSGFTASTNEVILNKLDATNTAINFDWDIPSYTINTPLNAYAVEYDVMEGDFSDPLNSIGVVTNQKSFTHAELNAIATKLNLAPYQAGQFKVRIKASLNYGTLPVYSSSKIVTVTPFDAFEYPLPSELYLQGDALASNLGYPIPENQKMVQIDDHRFGLVVYLTSGKKFAFVTSASALSNTSYKAQTLTAPLAGGNFVPVISAQPDFNDGNNIKSPAISGAYKVVIDFIAGTYSLTKEQNIIPPPSDLYVIGGATVLGWTPPNATQKFTKSPTDNYVFTIKIPLVAGMFAFITAPSSWSEPAYRAVTPDEPLIGGNLSVSGGSTNPQYGGSNIVVTEDGLFTITVNFRYRMYYVSLQ